MIDNSTAPYAALLLRLCLGALFVAHAMLKVRVFTIPGTVKYFQSLGLPGFVAYVTIATELSGAFCLVLGIYPRYVALLLVPLVALVKDPDRVHDGQFFLWLAGVAPAMLFLGLEKLRRFGRSEVSERGNIGLCLLFAFGSVYFFCAEQGTVWFAAHVVGAGLAALYLLFALEAERPWLAGLMLGLAFATRTPLLFAAPLFVLEAWRTCRAQRPRLLRTLLAFATPARVRTRLWSVA